MKALDKIHQLRKSIHLQSPVPERAYHSRIRRPREILRIIESQQPSNSILYEARRGYIVSIACAFEIFWRQMVKNSIDNEGLDQTKLKGLDTVKLSMHEMADVFYHGITLGELISSSFNFQGVTNVNRAISTLLGIDAFTEYRSFKYRIYTFDPETKQEEKGDPMYLGLEALKRSHFIDRCFEIRHETVHNTGTRFRVSNDLISHIEGAVFLFNLTFGLFSEKKFGDLLTKT